MRAITITRGVILHFSVMRRTKGSKCGKWSVLSFVVPCDCGSGRGSTISVGWSMASKEVVVKSNIIPVVRQWIQVQISSRLQSLTYEIGCYEMLLNNWSGYHLGKRFLKLMD